MISEQSTVLQVDVHIDSWKEDAEFKDAMPPFIQNSYHVKSTRYIIANVLELDGFKKKLAWWGI